jgi:hypothetical protein
VAIFVAIVLLPVPPFWLTTPITITILPRKL